MSPEASGPGTLVSLCGAIGETISCDAPSSAIGFIRRQNPGASLGTTKETKTQFTTPPRPRFEWLEVAQTGLKVA